MLIAGGQGAVPPARPLSRRIAGQGSALVAALNGWGPVDAQSCSLIGLPQQSKEQPCTHPQDWDVEVSVPHSLHSLTTLSSNPQLSQTYTWSIFISLQLGILILHGTTLPGHR